MSVIIKYTERMLIFGVLIAAMVHVCASQADALAWPQVVKRARGQTVDWYMYGGFSSTNEYVNGYLAPRLNELYGIKLRQVPVKDIAEIVSKILVEKQAGKVEGGEVDLMWINGENFRTCKRNDLLYGPFADGLPNQKLVDWNRSSVSNDFGEPVQGLESPWGSAQVVMIYDSKRIPVPPRTVGDLCRLRQLDDGAVAVPDP